MEIREASSSSRDYDEFHDARALRDLADVAAAEQLQADAATTPTQTQTPTQGGIVRCISCKQRKVSLIKNYVNRLRPDPCLHTR